MALNRRYSAYIFAGTAMRSAVVIGLHLNIPERQLPNAATREHRKRLFWAAYVLDSLCASNLNLPPAIEDEDIGLDLPSILPASTSASEFGDPDYHVANISLAGLRTAVIRSVYGVRKQSRGARENLSVRVQNCLKDLQSWFERLPSQLQLGDKSMNESHELGTVSLHLMFYQVRPIPHPLPETILP